MLNPKDLSNANIINFKVVAIILLSNDGNLRQGSPLFWAYISQHCLLRK